jgi:hypothetical protein
MIKKLFFLSFFACSLSFLHGEKSHAVFVVGTHHYSPQKSMPMLASEIERLGFKTTVINPDWDPEKDERGLPGLEALKKADLAIATLLSGIESLPLFVLLLGVCLLVSFLTEMTSNTATTNVLMPILGAAATASNIDPIILMIPAAMSASCAFMLPVATIPNAVVFGTGKITVGKMVREGLVLNIIGAFVISTVCFLFLY